MSDRDDPRSRMTGTHPDEALAGYVDGSATDDERRVVEAHLASCSSCAEEIALARASVAATSGVEEAAAPGLDPASIVSTARTVVSIESRRQAASEEPRRGPGVCLGVVGGLAAASIVAVLAFGLLHSPGGGSASTALAPTHEAAPLSPGVGPGPSSGITRSPALGAFVTEENYTRASVDQLASSLARGSTQLIGPVASNGPESFSAADVAAARSCAQAAAGTTRPPAIMVRAKFEGRPAFVTGFVLSAPGEDKTRVVVTSASGCTVLYQTLDQAPGG